MSDDVRHRTAYGAIGQAQADELRFIMRACRPGLTEATLDTEAENAEIEMIPIFKKPDVARSFLRIEVTGNVVNEMVREIGFEFADRLYGNARDTAIGPPKLFGIDTYMVGNLPAPGWRVVSPFRKAIS